MQVKSNREEAVKPRTKIMERDLPHEKYDYTVPKEMKDS
jgi:hypothetical protein